MIYISLPRRKSDAQTPDGGIGFIQQPISNQAPAF
jgi:hypothetical protein